jgi:hypothetical protein
MTKTQAFIIEYKEEMQQKGYLSKEPLRSVGLAGRARQLVGSIIVFIHILYLHGAPVGLAYA